VGARRNVIVEIAAEVERLLLVALLGDEGVGEQPDPIPLVELDDAQTQPLVQNRARMSLLTDATSCSNDSPPPSPLQRGRGRGRPSSSKNSGRPVQRATSWAPSETAAGAASSRAGASRSRLTSLRWMPVSRLSRLVVWDLPAIANSRSATST
jgi:hypothetical protein